VWCWDTCLSAWNAGCLRIGGNARCQWLQAQSSTGPACMFMEASFVEQQVPTIPQRIEKRAELIFKRSPLAKCPQAVHDCALHRVGARAEVPGGPPAPRRAGRRGERSSRPAGRRFCLGVLSCGLQYPGCMLGVCMAQLLACEARGPRRKAWPRRGIVSCPGKLVLISSWTQG
jgi:hypothetical protein